VLASNRNCGVCKRDPVSPTVTDDGHELGPSLVVCQACQHRAETYGREASSTGGREDAGTGERQHSETDSQANSESDDAPR